MKPISYEEWVALNPDTEPVDCETCGGSGERECDCCGQFSRCPDCKGTGEEKSLRDMYREQLKADTERAKRFGIVVEA